MLQNHVSRHLFFFALECHDTSLSTLLEKKLFFIKRKNGRKENSWCYDEVELTC